MSDRERTEMARFNELRIKRDTEGLTEAEADELGRLMARRKGRLYGSAVDDDPQAPDTEATDSSEVVEEVRRAGLRKRRAHRVA